MPLRRRRKDKGRGSPGPLIRGESNDRLGMHLHVNDGESSLDITGMSLVCLFHWAK